jgi:hypothetical protein
MQQPCGRLQCLELDGCNNYGAWLPTWPAPALRTSRPRRCRCGCAPPTTTATPPLPPASPARGCWCASRGLPLSPAPTALLTAPLMEAAAGAPRWWRPYRACTAGPPRPTTNMWASTAAPWRTKVRPAGGFTCCLQRRAAVGAQRSDSLAASVPAQAGRCPAPAWLQLADWLPAGAVTCIINLLWAAERRRAPLPPRFSPGLEQQQQQGVNPPGFQPQPLMCAPPLFAKQPQFDYAFRWGHCGGNGATTDTPPGSVPPSTAALHGRWPLAGLRLHLGMAAAELAFSSPNNRACLLIRHMRCWSFKADFALPAALLLRCRGFVLSAAGAAAAQGGRVTPPGSVLRRARCTACRACATIPALTAAPEKIAQHFFERHKQRERTCDDSGSRATPQLSYSSLQHMPLDVQSCSPLLHTCRAPNEPPWFSCIPAPAGRPRHCRLSPSNNPPFRRTGMFSVWTPVGRPNCCPVLIHCPGRPSPLFPLFHLVP